MTYASLALGNTPDCVLEKSRMDCHAKNVSSIVVREREDSSLTRMFLAWPGHNLHSNILGFPCAVGMHDHRYDIRLKGILGTVHNTVYRERESGSIDSCSMCKWEYQTGHTTREPTVKLQGRVFLVPVKANVLTPKEWTDLIASDIHNVHCAGAAAWWVQEGRVSRTKTRLYTSTPNVSTDGLYTPFENAQQVRDHVDLFFKAFG